MWKNYSLDFIRKNRASSMAIMAAALISSLFLSLLCCLFFNFWQDEIAGIIRQEGDWQGRITGEIGEEELPVIRNFANVEKAVINEELSDGQGTVVDVYFVNSRRIFQDMPFIIEKLGMDEGAASYHTLLLSRYLIHDPQDETPPLLLTMYLFVLIIVSLSLILIIHNSFGVSMNARIHQFGIFASIGATPGQICTCLLQEAVTLCALPLLSGSLLGIALGYGVIYLANTIAADIAGRAGSEIIFYYHPAIFIITIAVSALTVLVSAWIPAWKLSRMTPLEAIRSTGELTFKKKKQSRILSLLFGIEGELAGNALKAQKKVLRTSALSLTLSFMGFAMMECFFSLSAISTEETYFKKYEDVWDVMVTVKDTAIEDFLLAENRQGIKEIEKIKEIEGMSDCIVYQKAAAQTYIYEERQSEEVRALMHSENGEEFYPATAQLIILDDAGFMEYCKQIGITPRTDGIVILNRIWDSLHSNFRDKRYIPYVKETDTVFLQRTGQEAGAESVEVPVLGYTQNEPRLREEYGTEDASVLVHFVPLSVWKEIGTAIGGSEEDIYLSILAGDDATLEELNALEERIKGMIPPEYDIESENRIQEKLTNDRMIKGYMLILGAFCALLAFIGIANVFSNTLGFLNQRKRELARYLSIGLTPAGMRKMFCLEAFVIAGRPVLIGLAGTALFVIFAVKASFLKMQVFLARAPYVQMAVFILAIFGFVGAAYYIGARKVLRYQLADALRDGAMF